MIQRFYLEKEEEGQIMAEFIQQMSNDFIRCWSHIWFFLPFGLQDHDEAAGEVCSAHELRRSTSCCLHGDPTPAAQEGFGGRGEDAQRRTGEERLG